MLVSDGLHGAVMPTVQATLNDGATAGQGINETKPRQSAQTPFVSATDLTPNNPPNGPIAVVNGSSTEPAINPKWKNFDPNALTANDVSPSTQSPLASPYVATVQTSDATNGTTGNSGGSSTGSSGGIAGSSGGSIETPPANGAGSGSNLGDVLSALGSLFGAGPTNASAPQQDIGTVVPVGASTSSNGVNGKVIGVLAGAGVLGFIAYKKGWLKKLGIGKDGNE